MQHHDGASHDVANEPPMLWASVRGARSPTVVFEAGGGEDSSVWADLEPEVRRENQVRTMVYDRAGLGRSTPTPPPTASTTKRTHCVANSTVTASPTPVVLVAHSYGGFIATLVAAHDPRIAGVILVDANLAGFFDDARINRLVDTYTPQFPALERAAPHLARVMIPLIQAYPATVERLRQVDIPAATPTIDIVAERTWVDTPEEISAIRQAHHDFVAASPHRQAIHAHGSGHHVMRDRPDITLRATAQIITEVRHRVLRESAGLPRASRRL